MGVQLFANGAAATLSGTLAQGGTTMTLAAGTGAKFPSVTGSDYFYVTLFTKDAFAVEQNIEVVKVTARTGDTLTLVRDIETMTGQSGGFAYDGNATTVYVQQRNTAKTMDNMLQKSGNLSGLADNAAARTNLGLGNVSNTSDANKPISTAQQTALNAKAPLASPAFTGDLTLSSVGARIRGDFSNATAANRVAFQSSTVNGGTYVTALPNGTASVAAVQAFNSSDLANTSYMSLSVTPTHVRLNSNVLGTGTQLPLALATSNVDRQTILPTGEVGIGVTPAVGQGTLQVPDINGAALGPKNKLINGCMRIPSPYGASGGAALGGSLIGAAGVVVWIGGFTTFTGAIFHETGVQDIRTSSGGLVRVAFTSTTGGSGAVVFSMRISAEDALTMAGNPITASCRLYGATTSPATSWLRRYKANGYNDFSAPVFIGDGSKLNTSAMAVIDLEYTFTPTYADCINGMQIDVVGEYTGANGNPQSPAYLSVANFQVIEGSKRLPFEARPLELEKALVNRFKSTAPINLTANTTLASNSKYSYSAGALTLTLPAAPVNGDEVVIYNTGSLLTTVVGRNGKTIVGLAQDMTLDMANKKYVFEYLSASGDWRVGA